MLKLYLLAKMVKETKKQKTERNVFSFWLYTIGMCSITHAEKGNQLEKHNS